MKPILFNIDMVRAILRQQKSVTRRIVKGADPIWSFDRLGTNVAMTKVGKDGEEYPVEMPGLWAVFEGDGYPEYPMKKAPYQPGDILYVRETWQEVYETEYDDGKPENIKNVIKNWDSISKIESGLSKNSAPIIAEPRMKYYVFKADNLEFSEVHPWCKGLHWKPSIHMPKEAARIFLRVTGVRVERLQDMETPDDKNYIAEGAKDKHDFIYIWDDTVRHAELDIYGWDANPWVWVIEFEQISKEEAGL